jgi:hypothetical protein
LVVVVDLGFFVVVVTAGAVVVVDGSVAGGAVVVGMLGSMTVTAKVSVGSSGVGVEPARP